MNELPHFPEATPTYSTVPCAEYPAAVRVQYTRLISADVRAQRDAQRAVMLHTNLVGQLSVAKDELRTAITEWGGVGPDEIGMAQAGDRMAAAANEVLRLLDRIGN